MLTGSGSWITTSGLPLASQSDLHDHCRQHNMERTDLLPVNNVQTDQTTIRRLLACQPRWSSSSILRGRSTETSKLVQDLSSRRTQLTPHSR